MLSKTKILNAISKGIKTGFKFSNDNVVDDSSWIDFDNSKIDNLKSLAIKDMFEDYILQDNHIEIFNCLKNIGLDYFKAYRTNKIVDSIYKAIDNLGWEYVEEHIQPTSNKQLEEIIKNITEFVGNKEDLNWLDISNIKNLSHIFKNSKFNGDISNWNVSNVTDMSYMFWGCKFNGDISHWNVSNVKNMENMFTNSKFKGNISKWDVSNVTNMFGMFSISQFKGNISKWNVSRVTDMSNMFMHSQFNGDISNWKVSYKCVTDNVFHKCPIESKNKPKRLQNDK